MTDFDEIEEIELSSAAPNVARAFRRRIRAGFALCAAGLGTALASVVASAAATLLGPSSSTNLDADGVVSQKLPGLAVDGVTMGLLIAGFVLFYRVPYGQRWRWASTLVLLVAGADVAFFSLRVAGGNAKILTFSNFMGQALGWVELWMLAVLAAEAAEATDRSDITYQTEVVGKLIIWGGFGWLLALVWSLDPALLLGGDTSGSAPDQFTVIFYYAGLVLLLMAVARTTLCCLGLVNAYAPASNERPPS